MTIRAAAPPLPADGREVCSAPEIRFLAVCPEIDDHTSGSEFPLAHPKPVVVLIDWPVEEDVALIGALARANEGEFPFVAGANRDAGNLLSVGKAGPCVPTPKCATPEISRMSWGGSTSSTVIS